MSKSEADIDWEKRYQAGNIPWDRGAVHPLWQRHLETRKVTGPVGIPGCGRGYEVQAAALEGFEATGWDISSTAIEWARDFQAHRRAQYQVRDFFHLSMEWEGKFGTLLDLHCFCAFSPDRRKDYLRSVLHHLAPLGTLVGLFRLRTVSKEEEEGPPYLIDEVELDTFFSPFLKLAQKPETVEDELPGKASWRVYRCLF